jgi:hypothetical protein
MIANHLFLTVSMHIVATSESNTILSAGEKVFLTDWTVILQRVFSALMRVSLRNTKTRVASFTVKVERLRTYSANSTSRAVVNLFR